jgi:hypothetical protein
MDVKFYLSERRKLSVFLSTLEYVCGVCVCVCVRACLREQVAACWTTLRSDQFLSFCPLVDTNWSVEGQFQGYQIDGICSTI